MLSCCAQRARNMESTEQADRKWDTLQGDEGAHGAGSGKSRSARSRKITTEHGKPRTARSREITERTEQGYHRAHGAGKSPRSMGKPRTARSRDIAEHSMGNHRAHGAEKPELREPLGHGMESSMPTVSDYLILSDRNFMVWNMKLYSYLIYYSYLFINYIHIASRMLHSGKARIYIFLPELASYCWKKQNAITIDFCPDTDIGPISVIDIEPDRQHLRLTWLNVGNLANR